MKTHKNCNFWRCANTVGLFLVILFVMCFAWYYIRPVEQELHLKLFKMSFLGFSKMDTTGFILGAIQTYLWGYVGVGIWTLIGCCIKPGEGAGSCCNSK